MFGGERGRGGRGERGFPGRGGRGGFGGFGEMFGERPQRAERGAVKYLVMDAIEKTPRHGYEIIQTIAERSHDRYKPSPGVVYPTLQLLEDSGLAKTSTREEKKVYALNAAGVKELEENREVVDRFYEDAEDSADPREEMAYLMDHGRRLLRAWRRASRRGRLTLEVRAKLKATLEQLIEQLEKLAD